jgi:hypothetical protein
MLLASAAATVVGESLWWGILGFLLLLVSLWSYFLPCRYVMDDWGVRKRSPFGEEKRSWDQVRSMVPDRNGVLLSPFPKPSRLAKFRGLSVQFSGNRKEVLEFVRNRMGSRCPGSE